MVKAFGIIVCVLQVLYNYFIVESMVILAMIH
jgi:hypothetical protein